LAFETGGLTQISEELGLTVLQSQAFSRDGGNGLFATAAVIDAAFSEAVLSDGNNSEALELNDSQAMVLRLELFNEASILPLEEVAGEISVNIRTDMERAAATALGEGLYAALDDDTQLMQLLTENQLEWVDVAAVDRNGFSVNRQILAEVFAMPEPANGPERSSLTLDNGTFVIVELTQVTQGSVDSIPQEQRDSMINRMLSDLGNSDFQAFLGNLRESADIQSSMADDNF
jgi:peptidyl-prolyl cis-trans isomerase D